VDARRLKTFGPWIVLAVLVVVVLGITFARSRPSNSPSARAARLASELRCPTCESESVANSQSTAAVAIRADIKRRIKAGESDAQIRAAEVDHYTQYILLSPAGNGVGLIVWVVPLLVLFVGAVGLGFALRRWSRQPRLAATGADEEIVAQARSEP
jgi:cytochrome c-type biogenesis protein CcmH